MTSFNELVQQLANYDFQKITILTSSNAPDATTDQTWGHVNIYIGVGDCSVENQNSIVLNHKCEINSQYKCVTDLVSETPPEVVAKWRDKIGISDIPLPSLDDIFSRKIKFLMEDMSPDGCFAFVVFFARLMKTDLPKMEWREHVRQWELGDVHSTGLYERSWSALQSALSHSYFGSDKANGDELRKALKSSLKLLDTVLVKGVPPNDIHERLNGAEVVHARGLQEFERQTYLQSLASATLIELNLPVGTSGRRTLVSAYISRQPTPLGSIKVLARTDPDTWGKQGYVLMAMYRPQEKGSGNNMVISVDPVRGFHLKELWEKLEELEDKKWGGRDKRPHDKPRKIKSYESEIEQNIPNQPWWDDHGSYTIIAAPKKQDACKQGSYLTWEDVIGSLWDLYNPVASLRFRLEVEDQDSDADIQCVRKKCILGNTPSFHFLKAHWPREFEQSGALSPTVKRYFAACITKDPNSEISLADLPHPMSYDYIPIQGGFVIVNADGLFAIDDWSTEKLLTDELKDEFDRGVRCSEVLHKEIKSLNDILEREKITNNQGNRLGISFSSPQVLSELADILMRVKQAQIEMHKPVHSSLAPVREAIECRFSINKGFELLSQNISELREAALSRSTANTNHMIENLTIYGFPFVFFAGFYNSIFEKLNFFPLTVGIRIDGLMLYLIFVALTIIFFRSLIKRRDKKPNEQNRTTHRT